MILSSILLSLIQIIFTIWFVIRTSRKYSSTFLLPKSQLTKIGTAFIGATLVVSTLVSPDTLLFFVPTFIAFTASFALPFTLSRMLQRRCHKGFQDLLTAVVFELRCGKSLASSFRIHRLKVPKPLRIYLESKFEDQTSSSSSIPTFLPKFLVLSVFEFQKIAHQQSSQLEQLLQLQKQMRLDALLRHRSSQALLQTRIQCLFILFIFVCVGMYGLKSYPWYEFRPFLFCSLFLLASGLLLLQLLTRKKKWKT